MSITNRFRGVKDNRLVDKFEHLFARIQSTSPQSLEKGLTRATCIGGRRARAVYFYGLMDCILALQADEDLLSLDMAWKYYTSHIKELALYDFDTFVSQL